MIKPMLIPMLEGITDPILSYSEELITFADLFGFAPHMFSVNRRLTSDVPYAFRVRRDSDNLEKDIGFTGEGKVNKNELYNFLGVARGYIRTLYSHFTGSASNHAHQATEVSQPEIITDANGFLALDFDGVDDFLETGANSGLDVQIFSTFCVGNFDTFTARRTLFSSAYTSGVGTGTAAATANSLFGESGGGNYQYTGRAVAGAGKSGIELVTDNNVHLFEGQWREDDTVDMYVDGIQGDTTATACDGTPTGHLRTRIGANSLAVANLFHDGKIYEFIHYTRNREGAVIQNNISNFYGL